MGWFLIPLLCGVLWADGGIKISPPSLPDAMVGKPYSQRLNAKGCAGPCVWSSSGTLPPGLSLGTLSGILSGTPTQAGSFHFTATATDAKLQSGSQDYSLTVDQGSLQITTSSPLPSGQVGVGYSETFSASGGTVPYTWTVVAGSLPPGISLRSSTGALTGTPTAANAFAFTVQVKDSMGATASEAVTITIAPAVPKLVITTSSLPNGTVGTAYSETVSVSGGAPPYAWSVTGGALPAGLSLSATGTLGGTPTAPGSSSFTLQVTDSQGATVKQSFTLTIIVNTPKLTVSTTSPLPGGTVGVGYSQSLTATGGTPPYSWSVISGALPGGLTLDAHTGMIGGVPTASGTFSLSVRVTDSTAAVADQALRITIATPSAAPTLSFTGISDTANSGQQNAFALVLSSPAPRLVTGQIALTFQPDATVARDDPAIQFSTGSRTLPFTIAANSSAAVFPTSLIAFQTGTVAGTVTLAVTSDLPGGNFTQNVGIPQVVPVIQSASVTSSASGFQLQLSGYSNTRDLVGSNVQFTAAAGETVQTSSLTISLAGASSQWYASTASTPFGGQFLLVIPFTMQGGTPSGLSSLAVQLQNGHGASARATARF